jgi:hypothetical protein
MGRYVKMRRYEDEKMGRWKDVKMRKSLIDPHYIRKNYAQIPIIGIKTNNISMGDLDFAGIYIFFIF